MVLNTSEDHDSSDVLRVASDSSANSNSILRTTRNYMECCLFHDEARSISHSNNSHRRAVPLPFTRCLAKDRLLRVHFMPRDYRNRIPSFLSFLSFISRSLYPRRQNIIIIVEKVLGRSVKINAYRRARPPASPLEEVSTFFEKKKKTNLLHFYVWVNIIEGPSSANFFDPLFLFCPRKVSLKFELVSSSLTRLTK